MANVDSPRGAYRSPGLTPAQRGMVRPASFDRRRPRTDADVSSSFVLMTERASPTSDNLSAASGMIFDRSPLYAVLFSTKADLTQPYFPLIAAPQSSELGAMPHGLARDMAGALPGLWYCLHLPNTFQELIDIPAMTLKAGQALHLDHQILLVPIQAFNKETLPRWQPWMAPTLVVCPDDLLEEATGKASLMGFPLSATCYSQISNDSLKDHWRAIHAHFVSGTSYLGREPTLTHRLDLAPIDLPRRWLMRQMTDDPLAVAPSNETPAQLIDRIVSNQLLLAAISSLEYEETSIEAATKKSPDTIHYERTRLRFPVTLALPGVRLSEGCVISGCFGHAAKPRSAMLAGS